MTRIIRENGRVASAEVERPSISATQEHGCLSVPLGEVQPFFRLFQCQIMSQSLDYTETIRLGASVAPEELLDSG